MNSNFIKHVRCDNCGSSDANSLYSDGHTYCYSCNTRVAGRETMDKDQEKINTANPAIRALPEQFHDLTDRGISAATAKKYGVTSIPEGEGGDVKHVYPYFDKDGIHVGNKLRRRTAKDFRWEGNAASATLFGQNVFPAGSAKAVTLVEGECDAMAAFEMQGSRFPVVSVKSASSAPKDVADSFEYLNSFPEIVICFDKDEAKVNPQTGEVRYPGQEAAVAVAGMFPIGKVRVLTLAEHKDPNEYLIERKADKFRDEWWKAPRFTPTGLKLGKDMWDEISTPKNYETVPYPFDGLNHKTYGIRLSEFVLVTAETGVGKTSVLKEIEHYLLGHTERGIGLLHLEEPNSDTALGLMSISANKPLHLPDVRETVAPAELREYYDKSVNTDRVVIWDHFGSNNVQEVLNKIRHMHNLGCKYIVLDHLSIVVSDQSGDERKQLDEISTKIKTLCMELNIAVIAVIHLNRQGLIRGSAGPEQLANIALQLHRDKEDADEWRRNVTKVTIIKNRFCGRTGPACYLFYDEMTGRLRELDKEEIARYESGATQSAEERW